MSDTEVIDPGSSRWSAGNTSKPVTRRLSLILTDEFRQIRVASSNSLENLMQNAIEHGDGDVTITIGMLDDGFTWRMMGQGFPQKTGNKYSRLAIRRHKRGLGSGLSIVKRVVEAHEWDIRVSDSIDGGARFEITGVNLIQ